MKPLGPKKRAVYFFSFVVFFLVCVPILVLYSTGYRISNNYTLDSRGGIYIFVSELASDIYIDNKLSKTTGIFQREFFVQNLKPKVYLVMVANEKYWPWAKYIEVRKKEVASLTPFLVPRSLGTREVFKTVFATSTNKSPNEYTEVRVLFDKKIDSVNNFIIRHKMKISSLKNKIIAEWQGSEDRIPRYFCHEEKCEPTLMVLETKTNVKNVDFYPGRDDAIIISVSDAVYAAEIDNRRYHNFYPIYKGKSPDFRVKNGSEIYILDGDFIAEVQIER